MSKAIKACGTGMEEKEERQEINCLGWTTQALYRDLLWSPVKMDMAINLTWQNRGVWLHTVAGLDNKAFHPMKPCSFCPWTVMRVVYCPRCYVNTHADGAAEKLQGSLGGCTWPRSGFCFEAF